MKHDISKRTQGIAIIGFGHNVNEALLCITSEVKEYDISKICIKNIKLKLDSFKAKVKEIEDDYQVLINIDLYKEKAIIILSKG